MPTTDKLQRRHSVSSLQGREREKNDEERREVAQLEERIDRLFYDFGSDSESTREHFYYCRVPEKSVIKFPRKPRFFAFVVSNWIPPIMDQRHRS